MQYKKIITSGCSFSDTTTPFTWPKQLENYIKNINPTVKFDHRGLSSQGQELIQKKAVHAICEALSEGYNPDQICVFVMWSSNDRKSFYVDNPDFISELINNWKLSTQSWKLQLADLKNNLTSPETIDTYSQTQYNQIQYNKEGGWLITSCYTVDHLQMIRDYFMMSKNANSIAAIHMGLENIIFLQNFCKLYGIRLYQQYFMNHTVNDFESNKNHQNISYLYNQIDRSTFILSDSSIHEYLINNPECFKEYPTDAHPNGLGHRRWLTEVMLPKLEEDNFFQ